jgi:hypothetical protein
MYLLVEHNIAPVRELAYWRGSHKDHVPGAVQACHRPLDG